MTLAGIAHKGLTFNSAASRPNPGWLAHLPLTQEAAGWSPVDPAICSCSDNTRRSKSFDIAHGRRAEEAYPCEQRICFADVVCVALEA